MTDLQALLDRDPRSHTREDRDAIIRMYRERRHQYNSAAAVKPPKPLTDKQKDVLSLRDALKGSLDL
jgi:hypothetical protein